MSYYQDGASIIHLPASTHTEYSHAHLLRQQQQEQSQRGTNAMRFINYGTTTTVNTTTSTGATSVILSSIASNLDSGNLSLESHHSLMEAGELLLATPSVPNNNSSLRRSKPNVALVMSLLSFLVWLRLLQAMFYQFTLGHLDGFAKNMLCVLFVWIPSVTLTCFYFRSDDHSQQRRYFRQSWGR